jgi:hypothetical protein
VSNASTAIPDEFAQENIQIDKYFHYGSLIWNFVCISY